MHLLVVRRCTHITFRAGVDIFYPASQSWGHEAACRNHSSTYVCFPPHPAPQQQAVPCNPVKKSCMRTTPGKCAPYSNLSCSLQSVVCILWQLISAMWAARGERRFPPVDLPASQEVWAQLGHSGSAQQRELCFCVRSKVNTGSMYVVGMMWVHGMLRSVCSASTAYHATVNSLDG